MLYINIWAVLVAAISAFLLGGIWYSAKLFGGIWARAEGMLDKMTDTAKGHHKSLVFVYAFIFSFIAALVFALFMASQTSYIAIIRGGFVIGLCFVATSFGINYMFANRSWKLLLIDGGYHILQFTLYGVIIGLWR